MPNNRESMKKVLLISNRVMHYRVSVYNYFHRRFRESGFEFSVIANCLQEQNQPPPEFELRELPFNLMKELITWPLIYWFNMEKIPFAWWTKGVFFFQAEDGIRYQLSNYIHGMSDALILYSEACRELVMPSLQSKSFVANNTINFDDFPVVHESKDEIKKEFGIPFEKVVIFIGRMGVEKGRKRVDHLIDVFRSLDRKDIGLVLVGSGLGEELKARMNPRNTLYLGEVHDGQNLRISKLCKMADICAIPGHVGLGLNQALYWGLPVLTEECDQPPEISYLKPGRNGFIVPHNDLALLQDRMLYLLDNDRVRADFSRHAREDILKEASIEGMFSGFNDCVNYLTQR